MSTPNELVNPPVPQPVTGPKLLDQFRESARQHGHPEAWGATSAEWCRRFILFHGIRHPKEMGVAEIGRFLEHVAATDKDALRSLPAARSALEFLYGRVLHRPLGELPLPQRARMTPSMTPGSTSRTF